MLNRRLVLHWAPAGSMLGRIAQQNPKKITFKERETMLDELDAIVKFRRRMGDLDIVHSLLETAHSIGEWPLLGE